MISADGNFNPLPSIAELLPTNGEFTLLTEDINVGIISYLALGGIYVTNAEEEFRAYKLLESVGFLKLDTIENTVVSVGLNKEFILG